MDHRRYDPDREALRLGLKVISRELDEGIWGILDLPFHTVVLDRWLCEAERRSTLAHEIVHYERRDECQQSERVEHEVHTVAAHRLITLPDLLRVLPWARSVREMAEEWEVDDETAQIRVATMTPAEVEALSARESA